MHAEDDDGDRFGRPTLLRRALAVAAPFAVAVVISALVAACSDDAEPIVLPAPGESAAGEMTATSDDPFDVVMSVLSSPRCTNCHPTDDRPRQTDVQTVHAFGVVRDATIQTCSSCHHEENNEYSNVPGAPHWDLAPLSMGWLGLSDVELAETLLDLEANGGRSHEELFEHMSEDPLVRWAWEPGADREPPPVPHDEFVDALRAWFDDGAPIPNEGG